jgi:hypothetical protein
MNQNDRYLKAKNHDIPSQEYYDMSYQHHTHEI